jgi:hypothetical protein
VGPTVIRQPGERALLPRLVAAGGLAIVTAPADARTRGTSVVDMFAEQFDIDSRVGDVEVEDGPDEREAAGLAGEAADHLGAAFDLGQRPLEQVGNRYETAQALSSFPATARSPDGVGSGEYGATVRDRGAWRADVDGQAGLVRWALSPC